MPSQHEHIDFLTKWAADIRASSGASVDADSLEGAAQAIATLEQENERLRRHLARIKDGAALSGLSAT